MNHSGNCVLNSGQTRDTTKRIIGALLTTTQKLQKIVKIVDSKDPEEPYIVFIAQHNKN
jgi:hypothetical protein